LVLVSLGGHIVLLHAVLNFIPIFYLFFLKFGRLSVGFKRSSFGGVEMGGSESIG
jgi:hypothetical protein